MEFRGEVGGMELGVPGPGQPHHPSATRGGKPFSFGPNPSHYPTWRNGELPFPFCALCMNLELLQKGSQGKKKKKKEEVISDVFPGLLVLVLMLTFSAEAKWHEANAALAAACCFPGWQGHLVGRAMCAGKNTLS